VIVRISTEGQYRLDDDAGARLNELDNDVVAAVDAADETAFYEKFAQMIEFARREGVALGDDELEESDVILPPPDTTLEEAAHEFTGEGLIPD
jgi:hypothetical protein